MGKAKAFRKFDEARIWSRSLNLKSETEWRKFRKEGLPNDIPTNPNREYAQKGWNGWGDWLGTGNVKAGTIDYLSYKETSDWAVKKGVKTLTEWRELIKKNSFPNNIYKSPDRGFKKEWVDWGNFLQTNFVAYSKRKWRSFENARKWAIENGIINKEHFWELVNDKKIPNDIPHNLSQVYKDWRGWEYFLGSERKGGSSIPEMVLASELSHFFEVQSGKSINLTTTKKKRCDIVIKSQSLIIEYDGFYWHKNSSQKDTLQTNQLTSNGWTVIRIREEPLDKLFEKDKLLSKKLKLIDKCIIVFNHLLEMNLIPKSKVTDIKRYIKAGKLISIDKDLTSLKWRKFDLARKWVHKQNISSENEWRIFSKKLPNDIPSQPQEVYSLRWKHWGDWLGNGQLPLQKTFKSFVDARSFVRTLHLKDSRQWKKYISRNLKPNDIPSNPHNAYNNKGWISWMDWLGTEKSAKRKRQWIPYIQAAKIAKSYNLQSETEWRKFTKQPTFPNLLPRSPANVYLKDWKSWGHFLGTRNISNKQKKLNKCFPYVSPETKKD